MHTIHQFRSSYEIVGAKAGTRISSKLRMAIAAVVVLGGTIAALLIIATIATTP